MPAGRIWHALLQPLRGVVSRSSLGRAVLDSSLIRPLRVYLLEKEVPSKSDRKYLTETILPNLSNGPYGRVLFVGCRSYTKDYGRFFTQKGIEYWTTDIDPAARAWGAPDRHVVCDVSKIDAEFDPEYFDAVILNGVFGYGVDEVDLMNETLKAIRAILKPGGLLMIGWNTGLTDDPRKLPNLGHHFVHVSPAPLPKRKTFADNTHVYDFFEAV